LAGAACPNSVVVNPNLFSCLKQAVTSSGSAKDISKAENAYSRKRKNLLAYSIMYENSKETASCMKIQKKQQQLKFMKPDLLRGLLV
jgi:hypothetical protein